jgi:SNF2 family DNA or RNA helicase
MSCFTYHGKKRPDASALESFDVVLTTYETIMADESKVSHKCSQRSLQSVQWYRIVLDEGRKLVVRFHGMNVRLTDIAHMIRNRDTKRFKSINALKARYRWCLTGTPIFNRVEDLGSLLEFIGAYPFDKSSAFNSKIAVAVKKGQPRGVETLRKLVQAVCLRRTKDLIADELKLPTCHKQICEVAFTDEERRLYDVLEKSYAVILNDETAKAGIFQTILRLRQFCNHGPDLLPTNIQEFLLNPFSGVSDSRSLTMNDASCSFCGDSVSQHAVQDVPSTLDCGHTLCSPCHATESSKDKSWQITCLACAKDTDRNLSRVGLGRLKIPYQASSKVLALLRNLDEDRSTSTKRPVKR